MSVIFFGSSIKHFFSSSRYLYNLTFLQNVVILSMQIHLNQKPNQYKIKIRFYIGNTNPLGRYCVSHKANTWNLYWAVSFYYFMRFTNCIITQISDSFFLFSYFPSHSLTVFLVTNIFFLSFNTINSHWNMNTISNNV